MRKPRPFTALVNRERKHEPQDFRLGEPDDPAAPRGKLSPMMKLISASDAVANGNGVPENSGDEFMRIGEMSKTFDVTLRTLRFYEDKGLLNPKREGTTRLYTRRDRTRLKLILLGRKVGFSLRDVKQMMDLYDPNGANIKQLKLTLEKSEKQLARLHKQRAVLDEAIGDLSSAMTTVRSLLARRQPKHAANG
jgi:DNA-binding transcriptional MerR regulator